MSSSRKWPTSSAFRNSNVWKKCELSANYTCSQERQSCILFNLYVELHEQYEHWNLTNIFFTLCSISKSLSLWFNDLSTPDAISFACQNRLLAGKRKLVRRPRTTFLDNNLKDQVNFKYIFPTKTKKKRASKGCLYALQEPHNSL